MRNRMLDQIIQSKKTVTVSHLWLVVIWMLGFIVGMLVG
jgi:hypothetical protein